MGCVLRFVLCRTPTGPATHDSVQTFFKHRSTFMQKLQAPLRQDTRNWLLQAQVEITAAAAASADTACAARTCAHERDWDGHCRHGHQLVHTDDQRALHEAVECDAMARPLQLGAGAVVAHVVDAGGSDEA
eukprot:GHRQ01029036.1.p1 GENE.GHRQ01029036.1~~GHRQ01029036.1.p1  ORF type:complete len:131 (+),score=20.58 GHRQ01029036.1:122-514(+)